MRAHTMQVPYTDAFSVREMERVFETAAPLTDDQKARVIASLARLQAKTTLAESRQLDPSASALAKKFHAVEAAANALLKAIEKIDVTAPGWVRLRLAARFASREYGIGDDVEGDIKGVRRIARWAAEVAQQARERVKGLEIPQPSRPDMDGINTALEGLGYIWIDILGRKIGTAFDGLRTEATTHSPFTRFCSTCLEVLGFGQPTPGQLRGRIRRLAEQGIWPHLVARKPPAAI